ncbi:hypothetical protein CWO84_18610 [Methylomonas sp. Kb3]|uniref:hypothetical protein n=1 Tax=Methylomonas sp. Kb3 TaxID=1611544 RepID=UPI000C33A8DB|nr:hypothetical protein [Methylomonas sp. Kb3]PKD39054.1 hypothetical protein CWO84_18610 [Methylomonas sp. Kb3]
MLDDLNKSIKIQLYERVSSPLLASFGIAWLGWNYRFVLVLLTSGSYTEKFTYIDANLFPTCRQILLTGTVYPLATALFMLFVYPVPAKYVYRYWRERQRELKEIQKQIDDETPLTREEAKQIRQAALKATLDHETEIQKQSDEIAKLKEFIKGLQQESPNPQQKEELTFSESPPALKLGESQIDMLAKMAQTDQHSREEEVVNNASTDRLRANYDLQELVSKKLVQREGAYVNLTHKGRSFLIEGGYVKSNLTE